MISKKEQLGSLLEGIQAPHKRPFPGSGANLFLVYFLVIYILLSFWQLISNFEYFHFLTLSRLSTDLELQGITLIYCIFLEILLTI